MSFELSAQRLWEAVLGRLQVQVTRPAFDTWLRSTTGLSLADGRLSVGVPNIFTAEWLEQRMFQLIDSAVYAVAREPLEVRFEVGQAWTSEVNTPTAPALAPEPRPLSASATESPINIRHTFDSFVVSASNQLAQAAAIAVADKPGAQFNPLFIYSGVGMGKTHLLHAIAHRARTQGKVARYISTEQFTNDFITSIREHKTAEFRQRHRQVDLLLVDDIQFISGKEQTQEGFFHTFNSLQDSNKQVVIAGDRPPSAVPLLADRLRSRFEGGLVADIQAPEVETRVAILQRRAKEAAVDVPTDVLVYLAERVPSNVRQMEGSLTRLTAMAQFTSRPITLTLAEQLLGPGLDPAAPSPLTSDRVLETVASYYRIAPALLKSARRDKQVAAARQIAAYLLSQLIRLSPEVIGAELGGRDQSTILYSLRKVAHLLERNPSLQVEVTHLQKLLQSV